MEKELTGYDIDILAGQVTALEQVVDGLQRKIWELDTKVSMKVDKDDIVNQMNKNDEEIRFRAKEIK